MKQKYYMLLGTVIIVIIALFKVVLLQRGAGMVNIKDESMYKEPPENIKVEVNRDENYVVYINWDGFGWYYFEEANSSGDARTPVINSLIKQGVLFKNAYTGIPSITNPMQTAIVTGAWPETTGNPYRYYDKERNTVMQFGRENKAETIAEAAVRQGLTVASVHQFILENRGTKAGDPERPYITMGDNSDYSVRFDAAIKLINGQPVGAGLEKVQLDHIPRFIALYMDDLDGLGHNGGTTYGIPPVTTEKERLQSVIRRLEQMDNKLGEFIEACKNRGIYDNMSFILTADHGMAPYGKQQNESADYSRADDLITAFKEFGYNIEVLDGGKSPKPDTDIVVVSAGLGIQLSFTRDYSEPDIDKIINAINDKEYIGQIMKKDELIARGAAPGFADLYISPKVPYHFKPGSGKYAARGQHDSLDEHTQHIFSIMWGKGVKQGYIYQERMYNIDFARTMTELLGIDGPKDATGQILDNALVAK